MPIEIPNHLEVLHWLSDKSCDMMPFKAKRHGLGLAMGVMADSIWMMWQAMTSELVSLWPIGTA
tara:strand:+ start:605 stop:796 length:192 start_codon:yes stop_codon:yes gene_type:complete